jgi:hypothetical protein
MGEIGVRFPGKTSLSLLRVQTGYGTHPASFPINAQIYSLKLKQLGMKLITDLNLVP